MVLDLDIAQHVPGTSPSSSIHFSRNTFIWAWNYFGLKIARNQYMPAVMLFTIVGRHLRKIVSSSLTPGDTGGTVVVHVSLTTVTRVPFWLHAIIWLKLPWSHVSRVLSSLTLPSTTGFLWVLWFPPVVTLDPLGVAFTWPLGRTAQ